MGILDSIKSFFTEGQDKMKRKSPRVLFICKNRNDSYGVSFGLLNSASFIVDYLTTENIDASVCQVIDANGIDKVVTEYNPTHVVIEAIFVTAAKFRELLSIQRHKNRTWVIRIHSKIPFLANEGIAIPQLNQYAEICKEYDNFIIAPNVFEMVADFKFILGLNTVYLPNIYDVKKYEYEDFDTGKYLVNFDKGRRGTVDVGCFGAIRPMKNQLIQAFGAIKFAKTVNRCLNFHINGDRCEQNGNNVYKNLVALFEGAGEDYSLIIHPWLSHKKFIQLVKTMDIGMQVSFTETFNIVAADFVSNDIPFVGSSEIAFLNTLYTADVNSSEDIAAKLYFAWNSRKFNLHKLNSTNLWYQVRQAKNHQIKFIR